MVNSDDTRLTTLAELRRTYPNTPFLALGQTIWWDEPMKAVLPALLDLGGLGGQLILGVHDTDYFAKLHTRLPGESRFELLPHNDGRTRDLWSAAGEIAQLFGSECVPTRHDLVRHSVALRPLMDNRGQGRDEFLDTATEAWGWRGLVYFGSRDTVVSELGLAEVAEGIRTMLAYGFDGTTASIRTHRIAENARAIAYSLTSACAEFCSKAPGATLPELYRHLYPILMDLVRGNGPTDYTVTSTSDLLRFAPDTAELPRFRLLHRFLDPASAKIARTAYDSAIHGSEMYSLERFGTGAIPFDVIVPGKGRGTLRITLRAIHIETPDPIRLPTRKPIKDVVSLAHTLANELGNDLVVVGKAVALVSMLSSEFIFVFSEEGSGYVCRTRAMNDALARAGIAQSIHPILRLHYRTWDAADDTPTEVNLPEPMIEPFGAPSLAMSELACRWRDVVEAQEHRLRELAALRSPRRLLAYLALSRPEQWCPLIQQYAECTLAILKIREDGVLFDDSVRRLHAELRLQRDRIRRAEAAMSAHYRSVQRWDPVEEARRTALGAEVRTAHDSLRRIKAELRRARKARRDAGRNDHLRSLRESRRAIELTAEAERLRLVRNALLTSRGLRHANHRPSAWWLPMIDPSGRWFERIVETTRVYVEPLISGP